MRQLKIEQSITRREEASLNSYFTELNGLGMISADEEVDLAQKIKKGDKLALDKLVTANLRFVVSVAKQYQHLGVSLNDLINEGNIGLITAAQRFDETKGFKFISYAVWWVRQAIHNAIQQKGKIVRIPANKAGLMLKIRKAQALFLQKNEREPNAAELAEILETDLDNIKVTLKTQGNAVSFDAPIGQEDNTSWGDLYVPENSNNVDSEQNEQSLKQDVLRLLQRLDVKERKVLKRFFGLGSDQRTLNEIATELQLSKERIRQIKARALRKLSRSSQRHMVTHLQ